MAQLISANSRVEAWIQAANILIEKGSTLNLSLSIDSPAARGPYLNASEIIDCYLTDQGQQPMHTVAETIFPGYEYLNRGPKGVFEYYPNVVYPSIAMHPKITWGTYAYRLVRKQTINGALTNPLRQMIEKMTDELQKNGPKRSCYEIEIAGSEYDLTLFDSTRVRTH